MAVGESSPGQIEILRQHISHRQSCEARWELRQQGMAAFPNVNRDAMVARLHQLSAHITPAEPPSLWAQIRSVFAQPAVFGTSMAFFAIVMMLMMRPPSGGPIDDLDLDTVRPKGASFTVFVSTDDSVEILANGGDVQIGDKLRFKVTPEEGIEVMVVGQEADGKIYMAFPLDGSEASRPSTASQDGILPGTIALDETVGKEKLHLISCEHPFGLSNVETSTDAIVVPKGCVTTAFEINKVSP